MQELKIGIHRLVDVILAKNPEAKIFYLPVLPRVRDNKYAKQYIIEINKTMSAVVKAMDRQGLQVKFLPIHNLFIVNGEPDQKLFESDGLTLTSEGCYLFKHGVMQAAGFRKNE